MRACVRACVRGLCIYFCHVLKQFTLAVIDFDYAWRCVEREREGVEGLYFVTFAYRHFHGTLHSLRIFHFAYQASRTLRSSCQKLLDVSKRNVKSFSESSFSFAAPSVWKSLPASLRNLPTLSEFKTQLKSILCRQAFS